MSASGARRHNPSRTRSPPRMPSSQKWTIATRMRELSKVYHLTVPRQVMDLSYLVLVGPVHDRSVAIARLRRDMTGRFRHLSGRVLWQMATVGVSTGVVKVAGAAKVVLMARAFGMSDGLDAYLIAFVLPSFVSDTLSGSLPSALLPAFIEAREKQGRAAALRLYASVLRNALTLLAVVAPGLAALPPWRRRPLPPGV